MSPILSERCRIHAEKMQGEGWYVTANVLAEAGEALEVLAREIDRLQRALEASRYIGGLNTYKDKVTPPPRL